MTANRVSHGTERGYNKHRRNGTEPCADCRKAHAAEHRARRTTAQLLRELISVLDEAAADAGWY